MTWKFCVFHSYCVSHFELTRGSSQRLVHLNSQSLAGGAALKGFETFGRCWPTGERSLGSRHSESHSRPTSSQLSVSRALTQSNQSHPTDTAVPASCPHH